MHTDRDGAVVAGSARDEEQTSTAPDLLKIFLEPAQHYRVRLKVDATTHRVHDRIGLLKDLFLHEGAVVTWRPTTRVHTKIKIQEHLFQRENIISKEFF